MHALTASRTSQVDEPNRLSRDCLWLPGDEDTSTPTAVAESRLKAVPEGAGEATESATPEAVVADNMQQAAGAQDFPEAAQRGPSRQPSRKSLDWKRQESMLIGSVSTPYVLPETPCVPLVCSPQPCPHPRLHK
jgi:hypothetical protein